MPADTDTPSFLALLGMLQKGQLAEDGNEALQVLQNAIRETGKPGSLIVELTIKPIPGDAVQIYSIIKIKQPRPDASPTVFFLTEHGLSRRHPDQAELFPNIRDVTPTNQQEAI